MDPSNIPFNVLIVGPRNSGKTQSLVSQLCGPLRDKFDYIVIICPTFAHNKTYYRFAEKDPRFFVVICKQNQVEKWLTVQKHHLFEGTNTLCTTTPLHHLKDVKGRTSWSVSAFRENVAAIVLFYTLSANTTKAICEDYAGKLIKEEYKALISKLKSIFCGSRVGPLLKNQSNISCSSVLHCSFWSDRLAKLLLFLCNNSAKFSDSINIRFIHGTFASFLLFLYTITHFLSQPNAFIARFLFCASGLFDTFVNRIFALSLQVFPIMWRT